MGTYKPYQPFPDGVRSLIFLAGSIEIGKAQAWQEEVNKDYFSCPKGFWRKGNIDITAERNDLIVYQSLEVLIQALKTHLTELLKD